MLTSRYLTRVAAFATALMLALSNVQPAYAAAPANDNFASATVIGALPFSDTVDITDATVESGEPQFCGQSPQTVWYSFTPGANAVVKVDMQGSSFSDTLLDVYQAFGSGFGGLSVLGCSNFGGSVTFHAQAGVTYYIQAGKFFAGAGSLTVNVQVIPPPPNDNFADATVIASLPFRDVTDMSAATIEAGEPTPSCAFNTLQGTIWYSFTPGTSGSISARTFTDIGFSTIAAYTGDSLAGLTQVGCTNFNGPLTFHVNAGTAYYLQLGTTSGAGGPLLEFDLDLAPSPVANFSFSPPDPSVFDTVQFCDESFDPGNAGFQSFSWDLGDGSTATTSGCLNHQYVADADYTVQHTVTTVDGRTASTSQVVHVQTHDIAITKISAPLSANSGQTRSITVSVNSKRYTETVRIDLYKSVLGGFQLIASSTQSVPVRPANRTTNFAFNYTFTSSDASVGKVSFEAIATIVNARDVFPADNLLVSSPPTKVTR